MMNKDLATSTSWTPHERLLRKFLSVLGAITSVSILFSLIMAAVLGFPYQIILITGVSIAFAATTWWAYTTLGTSQFRTAMLIFTVTELIGAIIISMVIHNGEYVLFGAIIMAMMIMAVADFPETIPWVGGVGFVAFLLIAALNIAGVLDDLHYETNQAILWFVPSLAATMLATSALLLVWLNRLLRTAITEAEHRSQEAEYARVRVTEALQQAEAQTEAQTRMLNLIQDLETPVIPVLPGTLVLPIVGHLDTRRIVMLTETLLDTIDDTRAHTVLIDMTGVSLIDTATANHLMQLVNSSRLLGSKCILTGIRSEVAQTLVSLGVDWSGIATAASLQEAIVELSAEI